MQVKDLKESKSYFICKPSVVLREYKDGKGKVNHLILGDWLRYAGEHYLHKWKTSKGIARSQRYVKVKCRGDTGWLKLDDFDKERCLEVNFVDVGQGDGCHIVTPEDKVLLVDAGKDDNMERFLSWRYNLRERNVRGTPSFKKDISEKKPWKIDYVVMSHPDEDHYGGFAPVFKNKKLSFDKVYHNGIVERPQETKVTGVTYKYDLGGTFKADGEDYLFDYITGSSAHKKRVKNFPKTTKRLISAFRALYANTSKAKVAALGVRMDSLNAETYMPDFEKNKKFSLQLLGPIQERKKFKGKTKTTVRLLGDEGVTKNGHSVIFKARYGKLSLLLGGDLNSQSQNFLMQSYAGTAHSPEDIEKGIKKLKSKRQPLKKKDQDKLDLLLGEQAVMRKKGRETFEVDVAKACHHGSQHIIDQFIKSVNAVATVISSGDGEKHSHPRPEALGAYGKLGRGNRPLIFSTELARSSFEFTPKVKNYMAIRGIMLQIEAEPDEGKKAALIAELESKKDRNVAVYGMITLRALGDQVIIAQKLEEPRSVSQKWDIYELEYDQTEGQYRYDSH